MMTRESAFALAQDISGSITGEGILHSSGYFEIVRHCIGGTDYIGVVDVYSEEFEPDWFYGSATEKTHKFCVYSVATAECGENICEPETDVLEDDSVGALADYLLELANTAFTAQEFRRLISCAS